MSKKRVRELHARRRDLERTLSNCETALIMAIHVEPLGEVLLGSAQIARARDLALEALAQELSAIDADLKRLSAA